MPRIWIAQYLIACSIICCAIPCLAFSGSIALSFDDAPTGDSTIFSGEERSKKIVAALQKNTVADALFFIKADNINASSRSRLELYSAAGYHLANHSFSHQSANELSLKDFLLDASNADLALKKFNNVLPYFRPPYLHYGRDLAAVTALRDGLQALGYQDGFVTIDNYDWYINALLVKAAEEQRPIDYKKARDLYIQVIWEAIVFFDEIAIQTLGRSPKHILLLHENDSTALFLDDLIKHIKHNGGKIISPQEAYADPAYKDWPITAFQKQGRIAALAASRGVPEERLRHPAESTEYLDALFNAKQVINQNEQNSSQNNIKHENMSNISLKK